MEKGERGGGEELQIALDHHLNLVQAVQEQDRVLVRGSDNHLSAGAVQRTGSPIGDFSRNYASFFFAKLVAFKLSFWI